MSDQEQEEKREREAMKRARSLADYEGSLAAWLKLRNSSEADAVVSLLKAKLHTIESDALTEVTTPHPSMMGMWLSRSRESAPKKVLLAAIVLLENADKLKELSKIHDDILREQQNVSYYRKECRKLNKMHTEAQSESTKAHNRIRRIQKEHKKFHARCARCKEV